jgi:hypothetical protein
MRLSKEFDTDSVGFFNLHIELLLLCMIEEVI